MDVWAVTIDARRSLLAVFEGLDDPQWDVPSLCGEWTVRQVLAHLVLAARPPAGRYAVAVAKAGGSFDKANHALAVADAGQSVADLLANYRAVLDHRFAPPGWPAAAPLSDILLHALDVRIPLGLPSDQAAADYEPVMGLLFRRFARSFTVDGRPTVRWVATDHPWSHGDGPEARGTMADLALTAAGRSAHVGRLEGDGAALLAAWLH